MSCSLFGGTRAGGLLLVIGVTAFCCGCGHNGNKAVYPVHGKVLGPNRRPSEGALVIFHPVDPSVTDSTKPLAYVKNDGSFALTTYTQEDGAPEGEYAITIEWRPQSANPFAAKKETKDKLQGKYKDPKTSQLHFKVEKKDLNEVPTINLQ